MPDPAASELLRKLGIAPSLWLDGGWRPGTAEALAVRSPATGAEVASVTLAAPADFTTAIAGAHAAFAGWRREPAAARGEVLRRAAALLLSHRERLGELLTREQGKTLAQAKGEVDYAASFFQWFGEEARRLSGRLQPHPERGRQNLVLPVPVGVAGMITPWNFPLAQGAKKVAAALAAGCTAVWKPSELTPLVALALGPLLKQAGLPDGALQILPAYGPVGGKALTDDARIRIVSLTGSTRTGRFLAGASAQHLQKVALELGGNAPFIVMPDADLDRTVEDLAKLKLFVSGQVCVTANRIFVPAALEQAFLEKLAAKWQLLKVGNGLAADVDAGPIIHAQACERVRKTVEQAVAAGAQVVAENRSFEQDPENRGGSFSPPTILRGVRDDMPLVQEEIFGPVAPVLSYASVDEVVRRANDTPYGLAGYVYGTNVSLANQVADALDVGIVGVNEWRPLRAEIPFGGVKYSGIGSEGGEEGLREFCHPKVIASSNLSLGSPLG